MNFTEAMKNEVGPRTDHTGPFCPAVPFCPTFFYRYSRVETQSVIPQSIEQACVSSCFEYTLNELSLFRACYPFERFALEFAVSFEIILIVTNDALLTERRVGSVIFLIRFEVYRVPASSKMESRRCEMSGRDDWRERNPLMG